MIQKLKRMFSGRILPKKRLLSYTEARAYVKQVHSCWGGGQIDDDLISDVQAAYIKGYLTEQGYDQLLKIINPKKYD